MIKVGHILVRTLSLRSLKVSWEVEPTPEDVLDYRFQVLRSEAPGGPYEPRTDWFTDRYEFLDNQADPFHTGRVFHYQIRVKYLPTGALEDYGPGYIGEEPDKAALEVRRHWDVELREFTGRRCWLFPIRTFGSTCASCYDKSTQRVLESHCLSCFSTGFVRGYHHPVETWVKIAPTEEDQKHQVVVMQKGATRLLLGSQPDVKVKDLIVFPDGKRWKVGTVETTTRLGAVLHQSVVVTECERGDIEYEVPVNFAALMSADMAAPRNYRYRSTIG